MTTLSQLVTLQRRIAETKPKPQARGEGIRAVRAWKTMQERLLEGAITAELAAELQADLEAAVEFEPMLEDLSFHNDAGMP